MIAGYQAALARDVDIVVKIDGDGQMDTMLPGYVTTRSTIPNVVNVRER
jgi:hypothetical protein